jgi:protein-disulfide isomerase
MVTKNTISIDTQGANISHPTHGPTHTILIVLVVLSLILNAFCLYFLLGYSVDFKTFVSTSTTPVKTDSSVGIRKVLLDLEYEKVGWKENYDILQKYTQLQLKEQVPQIKKAIEWWSLGWAAEQLPSAEPQWTIPAEDIARILSDASIEGNKDASIIAIEYSDMECPFCMKQYHDTKLFPTLLSQYGDKVSVAFKNNKWVNHKGTEAKALWALCAEKLWWAIAYNKFYKWIMDGSTNQGWVFDVAKLPEIAKLIGLDVALWQSCVDKKETSAKFVAQTAEANKYGLGGTPGTLILNTKTGKYATIEWAYPYTAFTAKIDELLK